MSNYLNGTSLVGSNPTRGRVDGDFYATPASAIIPILERETLSGTVLEPACGDGAISKQILLKYPTINLISNDLVFRGYGNGGIDFLKETQKVDIMITNPPFSLAQDFIEKGLELASNKVILFCKIQLLEGVARKKMFLNTPLRTVYVFSKRQSTLWNGSEFDENGKRWATTMCLAWFVWEKGYSGKPVIEWI